MLGEGELCALPPGGAEDALMWDGKLQCNTGATVGGFAVDGAFSITVSLQLFILNQGTMLMLRWALQDFIVLNVCPPSLRSSPLVETEAMLSIRLVEDRWNIGHAST